jgi:hypothetical protein
VIDHAFRSDDPVHDASRAASPETLVAFGRPKTFIVNWRVAVRTADLRELWPGSDATAGKPLRRLWCNRGRLIHYAVRNAYEVCGIFSCSRGAGWLLRSVSEGGLRP